MYSAFPVVHGFPGTSSSHGALGWSSVWLVCDSERRILMDTGPMPYAALLPDLLRSHGLETRDVTDVLLTHAHWDHLANFQMFPAASIWIGSAELDWAQSQAPGRHFLSEPHTRELVRLSSGAGAAVERVVAGSEILPGVTALGVPGHTPGHLAYLVEGGERPLVFAGDSVKNARELHTRQASSSMQADESRRSIERLRSLMDETGAVLVPGHDVPLELCDAETVRIGAPLARIGFACSATEPPEDHSIGVDAENSAADGRGWI